MFAKAFLRALALLGKRARVCHDTIGGLGVQSSSGGSVPFIEHVLLHTGEGNGSFQLLPFPSQPWGCGP